MTPQVSSTIRDLRVRAVRVPMRPPHRSASGVIVESPLVLLDVTTSDGVVGHSFVFTYSVAALHPTAELIRNLGALIQGEPLAPAEIEQSLAARLKLLGTQGLVGMALAAIDMALWDALARTHGVPLSGLLGGTQKPLRTYGAIGFDGAEGAAKTAEQLALAGFNAVKAKVGYPTVQEDVAVIRAIRGALGPGAMIMVDYNQSLASREAVERLRVLDGEGLVWVEEPTLAHDYAGHALIAREAGTAIQCGENWWGARDLLHAIEAHASDYVMLDVMKIGGVTGWLRAAAVAASHGYRISSHLWPEVSAHLLSVTPNAHWHEYCDWWSAILARPLRMENGMTIPEAGEGSGVEWDEAAVERCMA
jgi:mandelate racemase